MSWLPGRLRRETPAPQVRVGDRVLPLEVRKLAHARRLTLRLAPDGNAVRVSMPDWVSAREALAFATSRADWLAAQIARVPDVVTIAPGATVAYRGRDLAIEWNAQAGRKPAVIEDRLVIGGPLENLAGRTARWLEAEARRLIADDLAHYCARLGRADAPKVALSRARRRWGSCAADGTIRINWRLVMAPDAVRRSVVAHEVAHLAHFDHSPAFHRCLADLFEGSVDTANRWLNRQGPSLYQPFG
ncbi:M48 family metallopeptidase [Novosphingobium sp.]|uniref:M48 family metallopeptidase n=1 Tax=Novosphingobium sp. TaxID=1874826 RepID=UPI003B51FCD4